MAVNRGAVRVDSKLRTSAGAIFAAGDVTGGLQFTHYAGWQGYAAARNALFPGTVDGVRSGLPWAIFTDPAIGQVGQTLAEARQRHPKAIEHRIGLDRVDRAQADDSSIGFLKLVSDGGKKLLGASVVSPQAGELINELSLAIEMGAAVGDLAKTIHVYPTYGSAIQDLAAAVTLDRAVAGWKGDVLRWFIRRLR
ncbi:MAG: FAD-dependent oxidoreductase [Candidatus Dormibacteraceae bacterium]